MILILMLADSVESLVHRCHAPISSATGPWRQRCDTSHCHARASILQNYVHSTSLRLSSPLNNNEPLVQIPVTTSTVGTNRQLRKKELQTIQRWLEIESWKRADLRGLEPVLQSVAEACKQISRIVQRAQTDDVYGVAVDVNGNPLEDTNIQGEVQQKLDVLCNIIMMRAFCGSSRHIRSVASEEEDEPRCCSDIMVRFFVGTHVQDLGLCCGRAHPLRRTHSIAFRSAMMPLLLEILLLSLIPWTDPRISMLHFLWEASLAFIGPFQVNRSPTIPSCAMEVLL